MAIEDQVAAIYQSELGRAPDAAGLQYWSDVISSGQASLGDVRNTIASSPEAFVVDQYTAALGRSPEQAGREYWTGLLGSGAATQADVASAIRASTEAQGLLGGPTTTQPAVPPVTQPVIPTVQRPGMALNDAVSFVTNAYRNYFDRAPEQAGLDYWTNLLTSGNQTADEVLANIRRSAEAQTPQSQNAQAGIRQVPFGSQPVGGILYQTTQMPSAASIPSFQQFADPNAVANAFQQSLAYQAALPSLIPQFNPANIPSTYQQIAQPRQRLDIANVQVPDWLRIAAARDVQRADAQTAALGGGTTGTGGITSTTPGTIGGVTTGGGATGGRTAADLQAFNQILGQTYQTALGRAPETAGSSYWTNLYSGGTPFQDIVNAIMNSPEAQGRAAATGGLLAGPE